ncbi:T9SS type A sorting domain-containing protein [Flavobacterium sp. N502540]|uniref:T9SS type A sorting domain-containing protein n=1 Tax=Flavobacterium sp. N502540 TaxID=2986838 RepID=UPI0022259EA2|nr:T9SS type A sorting domain-containing protein [Flavobacterium sp. N502540]
MKKILLLALLSAFGLNAQTATDYFTEFPIKPYDIPFGLVFDSTGNLYVANNDYHNSLGITKITPNLVQSTFISLKKFPRQIALDTNKNFWVISRTSNDYETFSGENEVTKITPDGDVTSYTTPADIWGIAIDATGNVFYSERTGKIQKISTTGEISTFFSDPATLKSPSGLTFDKAGNLFVIDEGDGNNPLRKINPAGVLTKIPATFEKTSQIKKNGYLSFASNGDLYISATTDDYSAKIFRLPADDVNSKPILFYNVPTYNRINGITIYNGNLYASLYIESQSKVVKIATQILGVENATKSITKDIIVYPNPASDYLSIDSKNEVVESIQLFDLTGHLLKSYKPSEVKEDKIALPALTSGNYILKINNTSKKITIN